jgi:hypothetical protein
LNAIDEGVSLPQNGILFEQLKISKLKTDRLTCLSRSTIFHISLPGTAMSKPSNSNRFGWHFK